MPDNSKRLSSEELSQLPTRVAISNAYAFVKGSEAQDSYAALTFEETMQKQLDRLEGKDGGRSGKARIDSVESELLAAVEQAKGQEERNVSAEDNVNTPQNPGK